MVKITAENVTQKLNPYSVSSFFGGNYPATEKSVIIVKYLTSTSVIPSSIFYLWEVVALVKLILKLTPSHDRLLF